MERCSTAGQAFTGATLTTPGTCTTCTNPNPLVSKDGKSCVASCTQGQLIGCGSGSTSTTCSTTGTGSGSALGTCI